MATSLKKFLLLFLLSLLGPQFLSASERRLVGTELRYSSGGHAWTGLDLGAPYVVTRVGFMSSGNKSDVFLYCASRGQGKTFLVACFAVCCKKLQISVSLLFSK